MSFSMDNWTKPEPHVWTVEKLQESLKCGPGMMFGYHGPWAPLDSETFGFVIGDAVEFQPPLPKHAFIKEIYVSPYDISQSVKVNVTYCEPQPVGFAKALQEYIDQVSPDKIFQQAESLFGDKPSPPDHDENSGAFKGMQIKTSKDVPENQAIFMNPCSEVELSVAKQVTDSILLKFDEKIAEEYENHFLTGTGHSQSMQSHLHGPKSILFGQTINLETVHVSKALFPGTCPTCDVKFSKYTPVATQGEPWEPGIATTRHIYCWLSDSLAKKTVDIAPELQALVDYMIQQSERITSALLYWRERAGPSGPICHGSTKQAGDHNWGCGHDDAPWNELNLSKEFKGV